MLSLGWEEALSSSNTAFCHNPISFRKTQNSKQKAWRIIFQKYPCTFTLLSGCNSAQKCSLLWYPSMIMVPLHFPIITLFRVWFLHAFPQHKAIRHYSDDLCAVYINFSNARVLVGKSFQYQAPAALLLSTTIPLEQNSLAHHKYWP